MKVQKCTCKHAFQDAQLGAGMRHHNQRLETAKDGDLRCTVCGTSRWSKKAQSNTKQQEKA